MRGSVETVYKVGGDRSAAVLHQGSEALQCTAFAVLHEGGRVDVDLVKGHIDRF